MSQQGAPLPPGTLFAWHEGGQALVHLHIDEQGNPTGTGTAYPVRLIESGPGPDGSEDRWKCSPLACRMMLPCIDQPGIGMAPMRPPPMGARH